jgi:hypothetical protein
VKNRGAIERFKRLESAAVFMTHIGAFTVKNRHDGKDYVFTIADGQGTNGHRKIDNAMKLKKVGSNIVMGTGREDHILHVYGTVPQSEGPRKIAEGIVATSKANLRLDPQKEGLEFIVAGLEGSNPEIYRVDASGASLGKPDFIKTGFAFTGSGIAEVGPMLERDFETGLGMALTDLSEGLAFTYAIGRKAHRNTYVNDKFQIGLLGNERIRTLYHPDVELENDWFEYVKTNFGITLDQPFIENKPNWSAIERNRSMGSVLNDMYRSMMISCARMNGADMNVNVAHGLMKSNSESREEHGSDWKRFLEYRDQFKADVTKFIDTWIAGDLNATLAYLSAFDKTRSQERSGALGV